jgi:hypothetical protein
MIYAMFHLADLCAGIVELARRASALAMPLPHGALKNVRRSGFPLELPFNVSILGYFAFLVLYRSV